MWHLLCYTIIIVHAEAVARAARAIFEGQIISMSNHSPTPSGKRRPGTKWPAQVRLMVGIPVITSFFVLCLGFVTIQIYNRTLLIPNTISPAIIQNAISMIVLMVLLMAACAFFAGGILALSVTMPMKRFIRIAQNIASGDLTSGLHGSLTYSAPPELQALSLSIERMAEILNNSFLRGVNCGIVTIDKNGFVTSINQSATQLLDCEHADIVGLHYEEGPLGNSKMADIADMVRKTLSTGSPLQPTELAFSLHYGQTTSIRASTSVFRDAASQSIGVSLRFDDLTSIRTLHDEMRKIERLMAPIGFLEGIAHQMRNPLCSIRGYAQLIAENPLLDQKESADLIVANVDTIDSIIRKFLDTSVKDVATDDPSVKREIYTTLLPES